MTKNDSGVVAVIRTDSPEIAYTLAKAFDRTNVSAIEITMTVPNALDVIKNLLSEGVERLGGGTVRTLDQVNSLAAMGAAFVVSPHSDEALIRRCAELKIACTPGTLSPSEMVQAMQWGATSLKIFPISAVGGLPFVNSVLEPLPDLKLVVSGGVQPQEVRSYIQAGCVGVCMGGALWDQKIAESGDIAKATDYALAALAKM
jgi:2-dehydro-3-deoxyphosphogluconate aldolase/(4S)-4-hydroxy-2-oxoglutarate aldolase